MFKGGVSQKTIQKIIQNQKGTCDLTEKKIGDEGLKYLYNIFATNPKIAEAFNELELFNNNLTDSCVETLADILEKCPNITSVKLEYNQIKERGAKRIASRILKATTTLQKLDLYCNPIGKGVEHLAKSLKKNRSLTHLGLFKCNLNNEGVACLLFYTQKNPTLKYVNLGNNAEVNEVLVDAINSVMDRNSGKPYQFPRDAQPFIQPFIDEENADAAAAPAVPELLGYNKGGNGASAASAVPAAAQKASQNIFQIFEQSHKQANLSIEAPSISAVSDADVRPFRTSKPNDEQHWLKERKQMLQLMEVLLKDKQTLVLYTSELSKQITALQTRSAGLEKFFAHTQEGLNTFAKEIQDQKK